MTKILIISTIDFPSEWDIAGAAVSPESALSALRDYWHEASLRHPSNPDYVDWALIPQSDGPPEISATDPRNGEKRGWRLQEYDIWGS